MGAADVVYDEEHCYVYAKLPGNDPAKGDNYPTLGFIAHMDTSPDCSGKNVKPRLVENYDGKEVILNEEKAIVLSPVVFPELKHYVGQTLIVTDGTTLLGADDKAGVAEIMTMVQTLLEHPEIKHGPIAIGFTPDEEVGDGVDHFKIRQFGADYAYTVDGGAIGELEYENFNAASAKAVIHGVNVHPGEAKNKMKNASLYAMEFQMMLPGTMRPECTEGYEGFFHLTNVEGTVELATLSYIIRDHDKERFHEKKELFRHIANEMNDKYGEGTVEVEISDSYYNMKEKDRTGKICSSLKMRSPAWKSWALYQKSSRSGAVQTAQDYPSSDFPVRTFVPVDIIITVDLSTVSWNPWRRLWNCLYISHRGS